MKQVWYLAFVIFILGSCGTMNFGTPQPSKGLTLKTFYSDIQGDYADSTLNVSISKNELKIGGLSFRLTTNLPSEDEVLVKFNKNTYYANFKKGSYYSVLMCTFYENKMAIYVLNSDKRTLEKVKKFVSVDELDSGESQYLINPSKNEFIELADNELFEVFKVLERISE